MTIIINPLEIEINVASIGDSIDEQKPDDNMLNPTNKNDNEYILNIIIDWFIRFISLEVINTFIIAGAKIIHIINIPIDTIAIVFNVILNRYFSDLTSSEP